MHQEVHSGVDAKIVAGQAAVCRQWDDVVALQQQVPPGFVWGADLDGRLLAEEHGHVVVVHVLGGPADVGLADGAESLDNAAVCTRKK